MAAPHLKLVNCRSSSRSMDRRWFITSLQVVLALGCDPQQVALDAGGHLELLVLDGGHRFLGLLHGDAVHQLGALAHDAAAARGGVLQLDAAQAEAALDQLALEHVHHALEAALAVALQLQLLGLAVQVQLERHAPEVETGGQLLQGLVDGVLQLGHVGLADCVERTLGGHGADLPLFGDAWRAGPGLAVLSVRKAWPPSKTRPLPRLPSSPR